jgi:hypothetical protein
MINSFSEGLKWDFSPFVKTVEGAAYLPYPVVMAAAQASPQVVPAEDGRLYHNIFGGAVVTVELDGQALSLPVLDGKNRPIKADAATSRDISDSIVRAKTKVVAVTKGYGLALYAGDVRPLDFIKGVGVKPDSDLRTVQPRVREKPSGSRAGPAYVAWADAIAAAKLTDPGFSWEILTFNEPDEDGVIRPLPYTQAGIGYMVGVKVKYRGREHTEYLAIMGVADVQTKNGPKKMDNQPLTNPTSHDWNRAVMRCLTKAIALTTGYGLSVYAKEDLEDLEMRFIGSPRQTAKSAPVDHDAAPKPAPAEAADAADGSDAAPEVSKEADAQASDNSAALLTALKEETASMSAQMLDRVLRGVVARGWVSTLPDSIEALVAANPDSARKLLDALRAKREKQ